MLCHSGHDGDPVHVHSFPSSDWRLIYVTGDCGPLAEIAFLYSRTLVSLIRNHWLSRQFQEQEAAWSSFLTWRRLSLSSVDLVLLRSPGPRWAKMCRRSRRGAVRPPLCSALPGTEPAGTNPSVWVWFHCSGRSEESEPGLSSTRKLLLCVTKP